MNPENAKFEELYEAMEGETERGKIIILASWIDDALKELLEKFLRPQRPNKNKTDKTDRLFATMRPLGDFASRIETAHRLGLISTEAADCYDELRRMRNSCAHKLKPHDDSYKSQREKFWELAGEVSKMGLFFKYFSQLAAPDQEIFSFVCVGLQLDLMAQIAKTQQIKESVIRPATIPEQEKFFQNVIKKRQNG